ncbi:MAG: hypothetical protein HYW50_00390, partial [Candidatus Diapherotrites archaeon]|nr:hypothetical protein [Candidatus Diapherotrites archaeon]
SKAAAKMFTERMAKNGINYINVSAIELENLITHALVDIETLKQKLSEMDIVLQPFHEGSSLEQLIRNATPKTAVYEKITDWLGTIDRDLLELVHKNFKTRNSD